jgi:ergothioneine biosynthesis protein EgtB
MELTLERGTEVILEKFNTVRAASERLCQPLEREDFSLQPTEFVSPPKWHLAHTTWFFEQFILVPHQPGYEIYDEDFAYLFNSYYNNAGERVLRPNRGLMTRPTVDEVMQYRSYVTENIQELFSKIMDDTLFSLLEIGINHEQQHQELLAYDIKYLLGNQPTFPAFRTAIQLKKEKHGQAFVSMEEGIYEIGHRGDGFCFDNELAAHKVYLQPYFISNRLVTNGEYIQFIEAGGYQDFNLWHAEGWDFVNAHHLEAPLYWHKINGTWHHYTYDGLQPVDPGLPVSHVSYYETFAYACWKGMRLPTEFEWEAAASHFPWGQLWEWTGSAYLPYPGFTKAPGALGEYNGKFMVNQHVLRGASIATPQGHSRPTYRNFFHPNMRWMFSGIRLAK